MENIIQPSQKTAEEKTVGEIAASDVRKAEVFKRWNIDFCCGGKKTVRKACEEKELNVALIEAELNAIDQRTDTKIAQDFERWQPDFLADYIYNQHHLYYYDNKTGIEEMMQKVKTRHGAQFPELEALATLVTELFAELDSHFRKEEMIVFPFIKALVQAKITGKNEALQRQPSLTAPLRVMEAEHEEAGEILAQMQRLTANYEPPANTCNSFQFLYKKLKALDEDLHQHIHLENNVLFPKALRMEKELRKQAE